ncbi:MAG: hypothetical protein AB8I08_23965 [Sandaracinaceae bacterium]
MAFRDQTEALSARVEVLETRAKRAEAELEAAQGELDRLRGAHAGKLAARVDALEARARQGRSYVLLAVVAAVLASAGATYALTRPDSQRPTISALGPAANELSFEDLVRYYSGATLPMHNFPAAVFDREGGRVWIVGRGADAWFSAEELTRAFDAYRAVLVARHYRPEGAPAAAETGLQIASRLREEVGVDETGFTPEQRAAVSAVVAAEGWRRLATGGGSAGRLLMYAHSDGISVLNGDAAQTVPMEESDRAFAMFRRLVTESSAR